ncbi:MAG TPA: ABC transporter ATP-binding protein [bacterium]|nr:ABC transporter ATP-binding protein [bacterium]
MEASIALKNITKRFGSKTVLQQVSFGVEKGTTLSIVGPGAAGKTTLLQILTGLTRPDDGAVYIRGMNLAENLRHIKKRIGYMPETDALNLDATLLQNLQMSGIFCGMKLRDASARASQYLEEYHLLEYSHNYPDEVSASVRRRFTFIRAILPDPEILLLDAPLANNDYSTRKRIWEYVRSGRGEKTVVITHRDMSEAEPHADRIIYLEQGKIITDGSPAKLRENAELTTEYILRFRELQPEYYEQLRSMREVVDIEQHELTVVLRLKEPAAFQRIIQDYESVLQDHRVHELSLNEVLFEFPHIQLGV